MQISPGITHPPSRSCLSDLRRCVPYKFWALTILAASPRNVASYPLPVRQASALPQASSRFAVTRDTLHSEIRSKATIFRGNALAALPFS